MKTPDIKETGIETKKDDPDKIIIDLNESVKCAECGLEYIFKTGTCFVCVNCGTSNGCG